MKKIYFDKGAQPLITKNHDHVIMSTKPVEGAEVWVRLDDAIEELNELMGEIQNVGFVVSANATASKLEAIIKKFQS